MKFMKNLFSFAKKVVANAFKTIGRFVKELTSNAAGVALLAGSAVGFTKLATELPFQMAMPLWIESMMVAPVIGVMTVFLLVHVMRLQLSMQRR